MKPLFILLSILSFISEVGCAPSGDSKAGATTFAEIAPQTPVYTFRVLSNSSIAGDIYTDFGLASQTETGTGVVTVPASQDFVFNGNNTLAQWKLISGPGFEIQLYRNGVLIDDQTVTVIGNSVTLRADL